MSTTYYVGRWCFDESIRDMRNPLVELICAYGDCLYDYYVEWQYDKGSNCYHLWYTNYRDFPQLQNAVLVSTVKTFEELIAYCLDSL